jgi:phytoene synthase
MTQRDETSAAAYVRDLVRRGDQDRYWSALLAAEPVRRHLLALYAFNIELARIAEQVREPQLGEIRLEWWRGALGRALAGEAADHPILSEIAAAAAAHGLPAGRLEAMIEARRFDLYDELMPDFAALEAYLAATAGAVFELSARILGAGETQAMSAPAAAAYGLTGLARALPFHGSRGKLYLPAALLAKHGLRAEVILHGTDNQDVRAALGDMRARAADALGRFRQAAVGLPRRALPAFLPLALVDPYLKKLGSPQHHPLRDIAEINPLRRYALIWRAFLRGRI